MHHHAIINWKILWTYWTLLCFGSGLGCGWFMRKAHKRSLA